MGFKGTVIAGVLSTLIAAFISWLLGFWPAVWSWLTVTTASAWSIIAYTVPVPLGVLGLLGVVLIYCLASVLLSSRVPKTLSTTESEQDLDVLSENEFKIVHLLAAADGKWAKLDEIASNIRLSRLVTEQALEKLFERDFLRNNHNYMYGTSYRLSSTGRDYAIEHGLVR